MEGEIRVDEMSALTYEVVAVLLGIIGFCGFIFNLLVIIVIIGDSKNLWLPINVILVNLSIGDLMVSVFGNPLALVSAAQGGWYWSHSTCLWYAWLMSTLGLASIGNLTVMAIERYLLIVKPMYAINMKWAMLLAGVVWIYAMGLTLPPLIGWGNYGYEPGNVSCSVSWGVHEPDVHSDTYIGFLFLFGMIIPTIMIAASYYCIISTLRRAQKRAGGARKRDIKVTKIVALMIIAFLVAWTPYATLALAAQYFYWSPSSTVGVLPSLLAKSSICYNPIIYAGLNAQFSQSFKKLLGFKDARSARSRCPMSSQTTGIILTNRI